MTRRVVKPQPVDDGRSVQIWWKGGKSWNGSMFQNVTPPYGEVCERRVELYSLWVREAFSTCYLTQDSYQIIYEADRSRANFAHENGATDEQLQWLEHRMEMHGETCGPGIHMPRWASRLTLEVLNVRVERLQQIGSVEAVSEGIENLSDEYVRYGIRGQITAQHPVRAFQLLWDSINAKRGFGWDTNPWVWAVEFKRITEPTETKEEAHA